MAPPAHRRRPRPPALRPPGASGASSGSRRPSQDSDEYLKGRRPRSSRMPAPGTPLEKLGFLTIGLFDANDPRSGHETTLDVIALGEQLGFDSAFVRHRHLQYGISSPVAVLAAATQRTMRIALGTAVIPLGWENPLRLAEDLATVDILSGGRLNPGGSVGPPMHWDDVKDSLYPDTADVEDFSYERVERRRGFFGGGGGGPLSGPGGGGGGGGAP